MPSLGLEDWVTNVRSLAEGEATEDQRGRQSGFYT